MAQRSGTNHPVAEEPASSSAVRPIAARGAIPAPLVQNFPVSPSAALLLCAVPGMHVCVCVCVCVWIWSGFVGEY